MQAIAREKHETTLKQRTNKTRQEFSQTHCLMSPRSPALGRYFIRVI